MNTGHPSLRPRRPSATPSSQSGSRCNGRLRGRVRSAGYIRGGVTRGTERANLVLPLGRFSGMEGPLSGRVPAPLARPRVRRISAALFRRGMRARGKHGQRFYDDESGPGGGAPARDGTAAQRVGNRRGDDLRQHHSSAQGRRQNRDPRVRQLSHAQPPRTGGPQSQDRRKSRSAVKKDSLLQAEQGIEGFRQQRGVRARRFGRVRRLGRQPSFQELTAAAWTTFGHPGATATWRKRRASKPAAFSARRWKKKTTQRPSSCFAERKTSSS